MSPGFQGSLSFATRTLFSFNASRKPSPDDVWPEYFLAAYISPLPIHGPSARLHLNIINPGPDKRRENFQLVMHYRFSKGSRICERRPERHSDGSKSNQPSRPAIQRSLGDFPFIRPERNLTRQNAPHGIVNAGTGDVAAFDL